MNDLALFLRLSFQLGTPLLFATLGEILTEKVGHLNLGVEGQMMLGACFGFYVATYTNNPMLSLLAAILAGGIGALIYAIITVSLLGNQTVTGFAITIFGAGLSNFVGKRLAGQTLSAEYITSMGSRSIPFLHRIPFLGTVLFEQSLLFHLALLVAIVMYLYQNKTRAGLMMRMVGESPSAADASGIKVTLIKYVHIVIGGCLCGLGGAFLSLVYIFRWQDNITSGNGWIAVALVIFSMWNPLKAIGGAYCFGMLRALSIKFQNISFSVLGMSISFPVQIMDMMPYIMTIFVLIFTSFSKRSGDHGPVWLGRPYFREDR
ncbi:ABC transporter permease [uncultured Sphaerochaeta sp.]|uniref:ABC transporter permease n=1 Tax=uncultured Sphaerochaeta sp. TaxID=886478 RepID=UPI002A0A8DE8|nr:ABC transporter permease [uncultured Sphaerochaeta sp.]